MKTLGVWMVAGALMLGAVAQDGVETWSSMQYDDETGKTLGWDMQAVPEGHGYELTIYCSADAVEGPVHAQVPELSGQVTVHPDKAVCGKSLTMEFGEDYVEIVPENGKGELIPKRALYLSKDHYR